MSAPLAEPRDIGVLVSILSEAEPNVWANVEHSLAALRPRWSSLAIDAWDRPAGTSTLAVRQRVHLMHANVLARFSRVLFLDTAPRSSMPSHIRSSYSYRLHWNAAFGDVVSRGAFGYHSEGLPQVLIGLDADIHVPERLPIESIAGALEISERDRVDGLSGSTSSANGGIGGSSGGGGGGASSSASAGGGGSSTTDIETADELRERAARDVWVEGRKPPCVKPPSRPRTRGKAKPASTSDSPSAPSSQLCGVVAGADRPIWIAPRNLRRLREERDRTYLEMERNFNAMNMGFCCGRQNVPLPRLALPLALPHSCTASRGVFHDAR